MRKSLLASCLLLLALVAVGCVPPPVPTAEPLSPLPLPTSASPSGNIASPLPSPTLAQQAPQEPGKGSVTGMAVRLDGTVMKGITIYAARIEVRDGVRLSAVDPVHDVHAATDDAGRFVLADLEPGEYAIATQSPVGIIMPHNPKGEIVLYQVKADEQTDLGRLEIGYVYPDS